MRSRASEEYTYSATFPWKHLAGKPPTEEGSKGRVEQPDIEAENDHAAGNGRPGGDRLVHQGTHEIAATCKHHQGDYRQWQDETQDDLADHQGAGRVEANRCNDYSRDHRHQAPHPDGNGEAHKALHDDLPGHRADGGTGETR